ncbi:MAG: hypothetical protein JXA89_03850 [Anaerolineae bacterium]|nr:hypothetical protein [Anaerolineae bacterium]
MGRWVIASAAGILCAAVSLVIVVNAGWADWASNVVLVSAWAAAEIVYRLFKNRLSGQPGQAST